MLDVAVHLAELERTGFSVAPDVLEPELVTSLLTDVEAMGSSWGRSLVQSFHGRRTIRYFDLLNGAPVWQRLPVHPAILPVVQAVLGKDCLLSTYGTASIGPGEPAQAIHADDVLYRRPRPHENLFLNVMIALSDFTLENGGTRFVPGSHLFPDDPEVIVPPVGQEDGPYPSIGTVMPRGSVCFFLGATYHGGGANRTNTYRHGVTMAFCAGWLRPQENFTVAVAQEKALAFDPQLRALMGWSVAHGGALGHIYTQPRHLSGPLARTIVSPQAPQMDVVGDPAPK